MRLSCINLLKLTFIFSILAVVTFNTVFYIKETRYHHLFTEQYNHASCTHQELRQSFHPQHQSSAGNKTESSCWRLEDNILRLQANSIANRNHMRRLGTGSFGSVFEAIVDLGNGNLCSIAVKTDQCRHRWTNPFEKSRDSCIDSHAINIRNQSNIGAEYAGALVFEASKRLRQEDYNVFTEGYLPTWGVVEDRRHRLRTKYHPKTMARTPLLHHPYVRGILMPFIPFKNLQDISLDERRRMAPDAAVVARIMLPAARALQFVNGLGFAFGDILEKNVGLIYKINDDGTTLPRAMLFDNTKFHIMKTGNAVECNLSQQQEEACHYCMEPDFPTTTRNVIGSDLKQFKAIIVNGFLPYCQDQASARELANALVSCATIADVVKTIEEFR